MVVTEIPTHAWDDVPKMSCAQLRQLTVLATGRYGLRMIDLMDRAGSSLAALAAQYAPEGSILVVVGRGNNGGAGIAAACALAAQGRRVWVVPTHEAENYSGVPKEQLEKLAAYSNVRVKSGLPKMKFSCRDRRGGGNRARGTAAWPHPRRDYGLE